MRARLVPVSGIGAALAVAIAFYVALCVRFDGFASTREIANLLNGQAVLAIAALGAGMVILAGSIDLSVGAVMALASIGVATLLGPLGLSPWTALLLVLLGGTLLGALQGACISVLELPPFLVTLAGMYLARGLALALAPESMSIADPVFQSWTALGWEPLAGLRTTPPAWIAIGVALVLGWTARMTRLGRDLRAIGGDAEVARSFGVSVGLGRIAVHALSGALSALAGIASTLASSAGNSNAGTGLELDAIAACVVGGIALRGGRGLLEGALVGTALFGLIQEALLFDGRLTFGWRRIAIGLLLLAFLALQRILDRRGSATVAP
jgi:simple sugar transport system permease protein